MQLASVRRGGLLVSALYSGSGCPCSNPGRGTALCSWERHNTLIVSLSTQVYKWVPANLLLGVTSSKNTPSHLDKLLPDGPLGSYTDFTYPMQRAPEMI